MQTENTLANFEYSVVPSKKMVSFAKTSGYLVAAGLPLLLVKINFKNGKLSLEGDWRFLLASGRNADLYYVTFHSRRIGIEADIYPAGAIDLNDNSNDGLVFPVDGIIKDESSLNSCSGLIVLNKIRTASGISTHKWDISFYLYDYQVDNCEIKFKLPVYTIGGNKKDN